MRPTAVFIPDGYPSETYVSPQGGRFERQLEEALAQRGKIISIIGASKTGKTTLCERRFGSAQIVIPGSRIGDAQDLWIQAYEQAGGRITGGVRANPMDNAVQLLKKNRRVLVLDDFHYVEREVQKDISRQIKSVAYEGVTIVVLSLPHRQDDPVRCNPDLAGRVYSIDLGFWTVEDLKKIGEVGFPKVGARVEPAVLDWLAREALTSPQIMHTLCLETCRDLGIVGQGPVRPVAERDLRRRSILDRAARSYVSQTAVLKLRQGPLRRGPERKVFGLVNEGRGDVYELLVRTIAMDPPQLRFTYEEVRERAGALAPGERPDLMAALSQWNELFEEGDYRPVEWDPEQRQLNILDPHLFFWVRYSLRDGAEALDYIFATGRYAHRRIEDLPRLVILDLKLPKVNGLQVLQWIRADRHTRDVPVMILTSSESDRDVIEVHKLGVAAYVVKPLERDEFLQIARQVGLSSPAAPSPMQPRPA